MVPQRKATVDSVLVISSPARLIIIDDGQVLKQTDNVSQMVRYLTRRVSNWCFILSKAMTRLLLVRLICIVRGCLCAMIEDVRIV